MVTRNSVGRNRRDDWDRVDTADSVAMVGWMELSQVKLVQHSERCQQNQPAN